MWVDKIGKFVRDFPKSFLLYLMTSIPPVNEKKKRMIANDVHSWGSDYSQAYCGNRLDLMQAIRHSRSSGSGLNGGSRSEERREEERRGVWRSDEVWGSARWGCVR